MDAKSTNSIVKSSQDVEIVPFGITPDYLPAVSKSSGMENLGKDDYKTPRILLLQGLSPQLTNFPETARSGHFWHTGLNVSLGDEFTFVPALVNKRVILWRPRNDNNGGILAFSRDGIKWDTGGNQDHSVKLKDRKERVTWSTNKDVSSSRLTEFGSADPDNADSGPAATIIYEYLCYLPEHPELSPCVFGVSKTGLPNGKGLNTNLMTIAKTGKPINCVAVRAFAEEKSNSDGKWTVPNFKLLGWAPKSAMEQAAKMAELYADYKVDYADDENDGAKATTDEIPF